MTKFKLVLNCRTLSFNTTGIGQYIKNLGSRLKNIKSMDCYFFYGSHFCNNFYFPLNKNSLNRFIRDYIPFSYEIREFIHQYYFSTANKKNKITLYHEPAISPLSFKGPTIITVHDLSWILYPNLHPYKRTKFLNNNFFKKIEKASSIITDSHFIKAQIIEYFNISKSKIHSIPLGIDIDYYPKDKFQTLNTLKKFNLKYDYFYLYIGSIEPRKNLIDMIEGYLKLSYKIRSNFPLIIVGEFGWNSTNDNLKLQTYIEKNPIYWLKYQPKNIVSDLISSARLLIYPSFYEGFGLPPLESIRSNTPVLSSNIPTLKEVLKDYVIYAENGKVETFTNAMNYMSTLPKNINPNLFRAQKYSNKFTWEKCVNNTIKIYHKNFILHS